MWHYIDHIENLAAGELQAEVQVPAESFWFCGHFPGDPVLPGIAQLGMVYEAVCKGLGLRLDIAGFSRVKFKKIIRPRDRLNISIFPRAHPEGAYAFRIVVGGEIACSGTMALDKGNDPVSPPRRQNP